MTRKLEATTGWYASRVGATRVGQIGTHSTVAEMPVVYAGIQEQPESSSVLSSCWRQDEQVHAEQNSRRGNTNTESV